MGRVIRHRWSEGPLARAPILRADDVPEGVDVERARTRDGAVFSLDHAHAHLISVIGGEVNATFDGGPLRLGPGAHLFVPLGAGAPIELAPGTSIVHVAAPTARGTAVRVRDEAFVAACATDGGQALRWILTPQYLSRRIFLHHDAFLTSRGGHPLSWFHTTMFDVKGLPPNADGESVFKMSYNSRTEFNVCYDVEGDAGVRMGVHPYGDDQTWTEWRALDGESTYHLDEPVDVRPLRNKHEVRANGHVSLFCMFDPAPTGVERHRPGEYSDYESFEAVAPREEYRAHQREIARFDAMVDRLSWARARGRLDDERGGEAWSLYQRGRAAQRALEARLLDTLAAEGAGRDAVVARWLSRFEL